MTQRAVNLTIALVVIVGTALVYHYITGPLGAMTNDGLDMSQADLVMIGWPKVMALLGAAVVPMLLGATIGDWLQEYVPVDAHPRKG